MTIAKASPANQNYWIRNYERFNFMTIFKRRFLYICCCFWNYYFKDASLNDFEWMWFWVNVIVQSFRDLTLCLMIFHRWGTKALNISESKINFFEKLKCIILFVKNCINWVTTFYELYGLRHLFQLNPITKNIVIFQFRWSYLTKKIGKLIDFLTVGTNSNNKFWSD
jgi:hypothetical protein